MRHLENMAKIMLATGLIVAYGYVMRGVHGLVQRQLVRAVRDAQPHVRPLRLRATGLLIACNVLVPQVLWFTARPHQSCRCCSWSSLVVNVGMWLERFVIVVTSLHRDFLPSSWGMY